MTVFGLPSYPPIPADTMSWRRSFAGLPEEARNVRKFIDFLVSDCPQADEVVQSSDELFNNAIEHTRCRQPGGLVLVEVRRWAGQCVAISITDQGGPDSPRPNLIEDGESEHGRGLRTVAATATSWGWYGNSSGRTVTAVFGR
jgi:anti-sigma regulatory factor (Ser/Thr protein kinase)